MSQSDIGIDAIESAQEPSELLRCAGLPFVARRRLNEEEHHAVHRRARGYRLRAALFFVSLPVILVGVMVVFSLTGTMPGRFGPVTSTVWAATFLLGLLVGFPVTLLLARDWYMRGRRLISAMGRGEILRFEGHINWHDWTDRTVAQLVKRKLLSQNDDTRCTLEVFSEMPCLYSVNGVVPQRLLQVDVTKVAARPENPRELAVPASWYREAPPDRLERRHQSDDETNELVGYAKRFPGTHAQVRYLFAHIVVPGAVAGAAWHFHHVIGALGLAVALTGGSIYFFGALRLLLRARRLAQLYLADAQLGWVLIAQPEPGEEARPGPMEFLPISGLVWTIAGRPAGWRNRH